MALIGNIIIGFQSNLGGLNSGVSRAKQSMAGFQSGTAKGFGGATDAASGLTARIAAGLGVYALAARAADGIKNGFTGAITGASDLNETLSMTNAVLGESAPAVIKFADEMAAKFGLLKQETLEGAAGLGGLGKSLGGLSGGKLDEFTLKMTKLAADLQSSKNLGSLREATDAIGIGLAGNQSDVLKSMGVVMTEETVKAYALANGIGTVGVKLSEQEKLAARAAMITERLSFAHNDLENTSSGAANQFRKFGGGLQNFANDVGAMLLPAITSATSVMNGLITNAQAAFTSSKATFERWGAGLKSVVDYSIGYLADWYAGMRTIVGQVAGAFAPLTEGVGGVFASIGAKVFEFLETVRFVMRNMGPIMEIGKLLIAEKVVNMEAVFVAFAGNVVNLAEYIGRNWSQLLADGFNAAGVAMGNFGGNLASLGSAVVEFFKDPTKGFHFEWTPLLDGFKATAEQLPALIDPAVVSMQDKIGALNDEIGRNEAARDAAMAKGLAPGPVTAAAAEAAKGGAAKDTGTETRKLAGLAELGSKEAYSVLAKFQAGGGGDDGIKTVARNGALQLKEAEKQTAALDKIADKVASGASAPVYAFT